MFSIIGFFMKFLGLFCLYICLSALPALASEDFSDAEFEAQLKALTGGASSSQWAPKQQEELFDFGDDGFA